MDSDVQRSQTILQTQNHKLWIKQSSDYLSTSYSQALCVFLTFPAALGLAPRSNNSSATSTFPYFDATWSGVKPFCRADAQHLFRPTASRQTCSSVQWRVHWQALPWSSWSAEPPCLAGYAQFVHDLPGQRCVGVCVLLWWWSWGWLFAPAAAWLAPCGPSGRHNAEGFGHPGQGGENNQEMLRRCRWLHRLVLISHYDLHLIHEE